MFWCAKKNNMVCFWHWHRGYFTVLLKNKIWTTVAAKIFFSYGTGCLGANGLFHFSSVQGHGCKNTGKTLIMIFSRGFYLKFCFSMRWIFAVTFFIQGGRLIFFSGFIFLKRSNHLRFNSTEFINRFFQGVLVFKNLVVHTPVHR